MSADQRILLAAGDVVRACFGDRCVEATVVSFVPEKEPTVAISVRSTELGAHPYDYAALLRIFRSPDPDARELRQARAAGNLLFTGYVERAAPEGDEWRIDAAARIDPAKSRLAGTFFKLSPPEHFWSIARISGVQPEHIQIHDPTWPPPRELWLVMVPLRGIRPHHPIHLGPVTITTDPKIALLFDDAAEALAATFRGTGVWAIAPEERAMAFDAERAGLERIRHAVERLALLARYAASITPSGRLRPFEVGLVERIGLVPIVGAQTTGTGRKWLREVDLIPEPIERSGQFLDGLESAAGAVDRQLDLAVAAWRRATLDPDSPSAVVALVEALEFYVGETKMPSRTFSKAERRMLRKRVGDDWTDVQLARIESLLGKLNDPSYGLLLETALATDGVSLTPQESAVLERIRAIRNDVVHGRDRPLLPPDDLRHALALVGRILAFRAHRLTAGASS